MISLFGRNWSRAQLEAHMGDVSQLGGVTQLVLADGAARGVHALLFRTGAGLEFCVLIDRAFDIAQCRYRGIELGWQSAVGIRAPWFHEVNDEGGASFLRSFSGFLVTCGLDHVGGPHRESAQRYFTPDRASIEQPLHGRISTTPGQLISYGHEWRGDRCVLYCEGIVKQAAVAGEHLVLTRRIETELGATSFAIRDRVRNHSFFKTPHMLMYHINLGFPLLDRDAEFIASTRGLRWAARDSRPDGMGYRLQSEPQRNCIEQVYVHDLVADTNGDARAALINQRLQEGQGLGLAVEFDPRQLPYLNQWQNFQAGSYCMAIEPATAHALGRPHAEANGELAWLEQGDERQYDLRVSVLSSSQELAEFENAVRKVVPQAPDQFAVPREGFASRVSQENAR